MRVSVLIFILFAFVLVACIKTADPDPCHTIDTNRITVIGMISKERIKEIKVLANQTVLCSNNYELLYVRKKNETLYRLSDIDSLAYFQNDDWFVSLGCYIKHSGIMKNKNVFFQFVENGKLNTFDIDSLLIGKTDVSVIPMQDTAWLFSYTSSLLINGSPYYNFSNSTRMGCYDGYCFVSIPMIEEELCFDD